MRHPFFSEEKRPDREWGGLVSMRRVLLPWAIEPRRRNMGRRRA